MADLKQSLPVDATARKERPLVSGVLDYFPAALAAVAEVSKRGNDQHNPGQPLHHSRGKSMDHADCLLRHLVDRGTLDADGMRHSAKVAWRALALLQEELEQQEGAPLPRGASTDEPERPVVPRGAVPEPETGAHEQTAGRHYSPPHIPGTPTYFLCGSKWGNWGTDWESTTCEACLKLKPAVQRIHMQRERTIIDEQAKLFCSVDPGDIRTWGGEKGIVSTADWTQVTCKECIMAHG